VRRVDGFVEQGHRARIGSGRWAWAPLLPAAAGRYRGGARVSGVVGRLAPQAWAAGRYARADAGVEPPRTVWLGSAGKYSDAAAGDPPVAAGLAVSLAGRGDASRGLSGLGYELAGHSKIQPS